MSALLWAHSLKVAICGHGAAAQRHGAQLSTGAAFVNDTRQPSNESLNASASVNNTQQPHNQSLPVSVLHTRHGAAGCNASAPRLVFVTALVSNYETTLKTPVQQDVPVDFIAFVSSPDITQNGSSWRVINASRYRQGLDATDHDPSMLNSLTNNTHSFNLAKWFKINLHRLPELRCYDVVVWLDATIKLRNPQVARTVLSLHEKGINFIVYEHHRSSIEEEVAASKSSGRYTTTFWNGQAQPLQDVDAQVAAYKADGFDTLWFNSLPSDKFWPYSLVRRPAFGLYVTCFVSFDMRDPLSHEFLAMWRHHNMKYTTQDQISFPYIFTS